jgi:ligand-binding sensor domain-containing protein
MRKFLLIILLFACTCQLQARQPFVRDVWLNDAAAPVKVNTVLQADNGYQWLGTDAGLYRFNGRTFTLIPDTEHRPVTALAISNGEIYVGYNNGDVASVKHNNKIQRIYISNASPHSAITYMCAAGNHMLFVCTEEEGLFAVVNNIGVACNTDNGLSDNFVYSVSVMPGLRLLAATDKGINEIALRNGRISVKNFTTHDGLPDNIVRVLKPMPGSTYYWCGTQQGGPALFCNKTRKIVKPFADSVWHWGQINDILPMEKGRAWIATESGYLLEAFLNDSDKLSVKPTYLEGKKIRQILLGRSGIMWAATSEGMVVLTAEYMQCIKPSRYYNLNDIRAMTCDDENVLWFAEGKKLYKLPLNTPHEDLPEFVLELPANITCLYADKEDRLWIGTLGKGMWYKGKDGRLVSVTDVPQLVNGSILDISGTSDRLWVAGLNGIEELFYPGTYTQKIDLVMHHNKHTGIGSDYVYQLFSDRKERIWMATDGGGVCMYNEGKYHKWDSASGMKSKVVYSITEDAYGNIWAATLGEGLYRYDGKQWQPMQAQGVEDINISTIAANATGQLIVVNAKGIDVWYPRSGLFRNYPRKSFGIDSSSSVLKLSATDKEGNVYIPFEDGFIVFKNIYPGYDFRPAVSITSLGVFFKPVALGKKQFNYDENHISFRYEGVNFANADRLHYRYKLEGYNDSWVITNDESVTFPQLPDGHYIFRVQASLNNIFGRADEASYSFFITKPFWKRWWFIMLAAAFLSGISILYVRLREQNLRKLSSLQRERMMFEYEHLKSQVNPHFLFNSLNTLTSLIDEDPDAAQQYTVQLADLYRNMLSFRNKDLILLSEEWEILDNYIYIQKSRFGDALQIIVKIPEEVMATKKIVPLALQLLVENAIKHNAASLSKPLVITIEAEDDVLTVRNNLQPKFSKEKGAGLGLLNIHNRYSLLSKKHINFGTRNNEYIVTLPLL